MLDFINTLFDILDFIDTRLLKLRIVLLVHFLEKKLGHALFHSLICKVFSANDLLVIVTLGEHVDGFLFQLHHRIVDVSGIRTYNLASHWLFEIR